MTLVANENVSLRSPAAGSSHESEGSKSLRYHLLVNLKFLEWQHFVPITCNKSSIESR